jgi:hypothetical protein
MTSTSHLVARSVTASPIETTQHFIRTTQYMCCWAALPPPFFLGAGGRRWSTCSINHTKNFTLHPKCTHTHDELHAPKVNTHTIQPQNASKSKKTSQMKEATRRTRLPDRRCIRTTALARCRAASTASRGPLGSSTASNLDETALGSRAALHLKNHPMQQTQLVPSQ